MRIVNRLLRRAWIASGALFFGFLLGGIAMPQDVTARDHCGTWQCVGTTCEWTGGGDLSECYYYSWWEYTPGGHVKYTACGMRECEIYPE